MELITYIQNKSIIKLPQFKHQLNIIGDNIQSDFYHLYSKNVMIPDKIIMNPNYGGVQKEINKIICYMLFGYQFKAKDWQQISKLYPTYTIKIKLYKGSTVQQITDTCLTQQQSFQIKNKNISNLTNSDTLKGQCSHIYVIQLSKKNQTQYSKLLYYLPSVFQSSNQKYYLQCINASYFNNKVLQILSQYVSLQNNISCFKDNFHHEFEEIIYSGKITSFQFFVKIEDLCNHQVTASFISKLSQLTISDKYIVQKLQCTELTEIKKQIDRMIREQKKITKNIALQKNRMVQQIQHILQLLNLKEVSKNRLTYDQISSQILKKIRNQNIQNKIKWIKQQMIIMNGLDTRLNDLKKIKNQLKQLLLTSIQNNYQHVSNVRNQIKFVENCGKSWQARKSMRIFNDTQQNRKNTNPIKQQNKKQMLSTTQNEMINLDEIERQKFLKYQMIKIQFQMEKQLQNRKNQYISVTQSLKNILKDY